MISPIILNSFQDVERAVSKDEGISLAKELGGLFLECSARTRENVEQCFQELALKVTLSQYGKVNSLQNVIKKYLKFGVF